MMCERIARERGITLLQVQPNLLRGKLNRLQIQYGTTTDAEALFIQREGEMDLLFLHSTPSGEDYKQLLVETRDGCVLDYLTAIQQYGNLKLPTVNSLRVWFEFELPIDGNCLGKPVNAQFDKPEYSAFFSICNAFFPKNHKE